MSSKGNTFNVKLEVDAAPFYRHIDDLDSRTNQKVLKQILRNVGTKVYVPRLRSHAVSYAKYDKKPPTGNLRRSFGNIAGKDKRVATIFVGPRMSTGDIRNQGSHKGWVVNILENWKDPKKRKTRFKSVHRHLITRAQSDINRAVEQIVRKRFK